MLFAEILCLAVILDAVLGDPRGFPHPVRLIGHVITFLHKALFTSNDSFMRGLAVAVMTLTATGLLVWTVLCVSGGNVIVQVCLLYSALAWRDLKDETRTVFTSLINHDIISARRYLSYVVGRDTDNLNEAEIARAAVETIAENSADGVISVIFFAAVGHAVNHACGMCVGVWLFKAASTLDSMLGYESFGCYGTPSARLDDILSFIPARLGGIIIIMAGAFTGGNVQEGWRVFMSDRLKHKSPNSGHCESAFAGVLGVRLGGGACYGGRLEARPFINANAASPEISDIPKAWRLLDVSCSIAVIIAAISGLFGVV